MTGTLYQDVTPTNPPIYEATGYLFFGVYRVRGTWEKIGQIVTGWSAAGISYTINLLQQGKES